MSSLASLVEDLPVRVQRVRRVVIEDEPTDAYTDEAREQWLDELEREAASRSEVLPSMRVARRLFGEDLERAVMADLIYEMNRKVKRENGADDAMATGWGNAVLKYGDDERMPPASPVNGPAPVSNIGLRSTLRSYLDARESCDRYDALIRHAATALLLAEAIADGRA